AFLPTRTTESRKPSQKALKGRCSRRNVLSLGCPNARPIADVPWNNIPDDREFSRNTRIAIQLEKVLCSLVRVVPRNEARVNCLRTRCFEEKEDLGGEAAVPWMEVRNRGLWSNSCAAPPQMRQVGLRGHV